MFSLVRKILAVILILLGIEVFVSYQNWSTLLGAAILTLIAIVLVWSASNSD